MLRSRLSVDSGRMSRMLRAVEADGLVTVTPSDVDGRLRVARLTDTGLARARGPTRQGLPGFPTASISDARSGVTKVTTLGRATDTDAIGHASMAEALADLRSDEPG